jgi:nucleotide-binding universal stress UspA family protein
MTPFRRILFATDFSPASRRAFASALGLARSQRAALTLLTVIPPVVVVPEQYLDAVTMDRLDAQARRWSRQHLARLAARAAKAGVRAEVLLRDGDVADEITRACRSTKADLLVIGTHGRRGVRRFFLGSVADRLVATAPCPVLTVRGS